MPALVVGPRTWPAPARSLVLIGYSRRREHNENICGQVKSAEQRFSLWQKYRWRRRYNMSGVAEKPKPPRPPSRFSAQPRGAGGRYVARDRAPAPALHGLKALDPAGAARAAAACAHAKKTSDAAVARARLLREKLSNLRALILLLRAERDLAAVAAAQRAHAARRAAATAAAAARHEELRRTLAEKLAALAAQAGAAPAQPAPSSVAPAAPPAPPSPRIRAL
jgi:Xaa-Pro aminopeptidase